MATYDREEDELGNQFAFDYLKHWGGKTFPTDEAMSNIQTIGRKIGLAKIMYLIAKMDNRSQIAFLAYLGYFGENKREIIKVAESAGIGRTVIRADLWRVSLQLDKLYTPEMVKLLEFATPAPIYPQVLAHSLVGEKALRINGSVLTPNSARLFLKRFSEGNDFNTFRQSITPKEAKILDMALVMDSENFSLNDEQISRKVGLKPVRVRNIIVSLRKRAENSIVKFISQDGRMLKETDAQYSLILKRRTIEQWQLSCLSPQQYQVFLELTQPDEDGRYPSQEKTFKDCGVTDDHLVAIILRKLNNPAIVKEITDLRTKVAFILNHREKYSDSDQKVATFIEEQISQGVPLWSKKGIGFTGIAIQLGLKPRHVLSLFGVRIKNKLENASVSN